MKKYFVLSILSILFGNAFASGYMVQGRPLEDFFSSEASRVTLSTPPSTPENVDDCVVMTCKDGELKIFPERHDELLHPDLLIHEQGYFKNVARLLCDSPSGYSALRERHSRLGDENKNLDYEQSCFCLEFVSLIFKDKVTFRAPENSPSFIREIIFTKRPGVQFPYVWGNIYFHPNNSNSIPFIPDFIIRGADVSVVLEKPRALTVPATAAPDDIAEEHK